QLAVAVHPVERVERGHQHRVRRNQRHQAGKTENGHLQEQHEALSLGDDKIELFQGCSEPDNGGEGDQNDDERIRHLPKNISAEKGHAASLRSPINTWPAGIPKTRQPPRVDTILIRLKWPNFVFFGQLHSLTAGTRKSVLNSLP